MFCYQCEQAAKGKGCDQYGVCGKDPEVAALQDALVHQARLTHDGHEIHPVDDVALDVDAGRHFGQFDLAVAETEHRTFSDVEDLLVALGSNLAGEGDLLHLLDEFLHLSS